MKVNKEWYDPGDGWAEKGIVIRMTEEEAQKVYQQLRVHLWETDMTNAPEANNLHAEMGRAIIEPPGGDRWKRKERGN